jgi:hypothetical protein
VGCVASLGGALLAFWIGSFAFWQLGMPRAHGLGPPALIPLSISALVLGLCISTALRIARGRA